MFKTVNNGKLPTRGTKYSAMIDLYANEDVTIGAGETAIVGLGVAIDEDKLHKTIIDNGCDFIDSWMKRHYILLEPRSSLRAKGLIVGSGIIDIDFVYPNEFKLIVHNPLTIAEDYDYAYRNFTIKKGDRIAQATLLEHKSYMFGIESEDERTGGIGSTDK